MWSRIYQKTCQNKRGRLPHCDTDPVSSTFKTRRLHRKRQSRRRRTLHLSLCSPSPNFSSAWSAHTPRSLRLEVLSCNLLGFTPSKDEHTGDCRQSTNHDCHRTDGNIHETDDYLSEFH